MSFDFFDSSARSKVMRANLIGAVKYPWKEVPIGKSFAVPRENIKFDTLRSLASKTGKQLGKKFRVIDHDSGPYEVACLQMTEKEAIETSANVVEATNKLHPSDKPFTSADEVVNVSAYARENGLEFWAAKKEMEDKRK